MNTLELFEFPNFKGASVSLTQHNPDLASVGFLKKAQSLRVDGDPWIVFSEINYGYKGHFQCFQEGSYSTIPSWDRKISSVKFVDGGLYTPKITLYEHIHYGGKSLTLERAETTLKSHNFENMVSSHKVESGAWILYPRDYFKGDHMVTVAGEQIADYRDLDWNDKMNSLKPVHPEFTETNE